MIIVANFTPDKIEWTHVGITGKIMPEEIVEMDDSRAKHVLNKYGQRGLVQLFFGDDPELKRNEAMKIWREFWIDSIVKHNQHCEDQKEAGGKYPTPTKEIVDHAKILGIQLLEPWKVDPAQKEIESLKNQLKEMQDLEDNKAIESLSRVVEEIEKKINDLTEKFNSMPSDNVPDDGKSEIRDSRERIKKVSNTRKRYAAILNVKQKDKLISFLKNHKPDLCSFPFENREELNRWVTELEGIPLFSDEKLEVLNEQLFERISNP